MFCPYSINLIVQDALKLANVDIFKIRESVKYAKVSESRMIKFDECYDQVDPNQSMGLMDMSNRWNSTFLMLECVIKYHHVFENYAIIEPGYN